MNTNWCVRRESIKYAESTVDALVMFFLTLSQNAKPINFTNADDLLMCFLHAPSATETHSSAEKKCI